MSFLAAADVPAGTSAFSKASIAAMIRKAVSIRSVTNATTRGTAVTDWPTATGAAISAANPVVVYRQDTRDLEISHDGTTWVGPSRPAVCRLSRGTISVASGLVYAVGWDTEDEDTLGMHAAGANVVTIPTAGVWAIGGTVEFAPLSAGAAYCWITAAGTDYSGTILPAMGVYAPTVKAHETLRLAAGASVQLYATHTSSAAVDVKKARLTLVRVSA